MQSSKHSTGWMPVQLIPSAFAIIIAIFTVSAAMAQNDNKPNPWTWELGLGVSQNSGNVNNFSLKHNQELSRNDTVISMDLNYKIVYQKEDRVETNKGIDAGYKLDLFQYRRWSPFVAIESESNHYKGYDFKVSALGGVKFRFNKKRNDNYDYSLSMAAVYDHVNYTDEETDLNTQFCRLSLRPKFKQKIGESIIIKHTTFYQPAVNDFGDYIINSKTTLSNKLSKRLSLDIAFSYEYRSVIPGSEYKHYDCSTDISLKLKLGK